MLTIRRIAFGVAGLVILGALGCAQNTQTPTTTQRDVKSGTNKQGTTHGVAAANQNNTNGKRDLSKLLADQIRKAATEKSRTTLAQNTTAAKSPTVATNQNTPTNVNTNMKARQRGVQAGKTQQNTNPSQNASTQNQNQNVGKQNQTPNVGKQNQTPNVGKQNQTQNTSKPGQTRAKTHGSNVSKVQAQPATQVISTGRTQQNTQPQQGHNATAKR